MTRITRAVSIALQWLLAVMLLVMAGTVFAQVIFRYILEAPLVWSEELALLLMVWITFVGSALMLERREHITIDVFVDSMPPSFQNVCRLFGAMVMLAFNVALTYGAFLVIDVVKNSVTPGLGVSVGWQYGGVLVGGILLVLVALQQLVDASRQLLSGETVS